MSCQECDEITWNLPSDSYPYRVGNSEVGFSTILLVGCGKHVKLAIDKLNQ